MFSEQKITLVRYGIMAKPRKTTAAPEPPPMPKIGDKVTMPRSESVLEVTSVSRDGDEVNLQLPGTNLQWFRVRSDTLTFVERKAPVRTSNPFTTAEPVFNAGEVMERIHTVERENLQRLADDAVQSLDRIDKNVLNKPALRRPLAY